MKYGLPALLSIRPKKRKTIDFLGSEMEKEKTIMTKLLIFYFCITKTIHSSNDDTGK
jgi:hypothetical protein